MDIALLRDNWKLTILGENVYNIPEKPIDTVVPSTVYSTLLDKGLMPDPFYRDNELDALKLMENDFKYETTFVVSKEQRDADRVLLRFEGIDTLADIYINDQKLGETDNMNRVWEFDITHVIEGDADNTEYTLKVVLHSPTKFIAKEDAKCPVGASSDAMPGFPHIRKAACMFGWDWGPRLPDAGIFREVKLISVKSARLADIYIDQLHHVKEKTIRGNVVESVDVSVDAEIEWMPGITDGNVIIRLSVEAPDGETAATNESVCIDPLTDSKPSSNLTGLKCHVRSNHLKAGVTIVNPQLWWPNGYGDQPLYKVKVELVSKEDESVLDVFEKRIGLRTATVNTDPKPGEEFEEHMKDQTPDLDDGNDMLISEGTRRILVSEKQAKKVEGRNFAFEVNGLQFFAMGADYIPEDNLLTRQNRERTDMLLSSAKEANHNCIRIWGGGYYLDDFFYDVCDEKGLLIWHDFMFACASYELTDAFEENISIEIRQNIRRLRSHPSIGLWCGNNEMETQYETLVWQKSKKQTYDYIHLYEYIIPKLVKEEDPKAFYWPSSPSSGGNFENSNAENVGDVHYWGVWHGNEPFTAYRKHHYRFLSEFGFQSFPALQTVKRFAEEGDFNVYSRVMEMHQRNTAANGKIMNYMSQTYLYPKSFDELLYCSQLLQADAIRYGVEHFRRFRGTCMGTVVWQLNDIWPVASWASLDYYGNWKALHYAEKKMFAPVLLSCEEHGEIDQKPYVNTLPQPVDVSADLHVANETAEPVSGVVRWSLRNPDSSVVREGSFDFTAPAFGGTWLPHLDFNGEDRLKVHLYYELVIGGEVVSTGSTLFCAPKHYHFLEPGLEVSRNGDIITVTAKNYAKSVSIETEEGVLRLDDNFVDMEKGDKTFKILPTRDFTAYGKEGVGSALSKASDGKLRVRSVYEVAEN